MGYSNYRDIAAAIAERREFVGNSASGAYYGKQYRVYSYGTEIARYDGYDYVLNTHKYSVTTSKLQNIIRRAWAAKPVVELDAADYRVWVK